MARFLPPRLNPPWHDITVAVSWTAECAYPLADLAEIRKYRTAALGWSTKGKIKFGRTGEMRMSRTTFAALAARAMRDRVEAATVERINQLLCLNNLPPVVIHDTFPDWLVQVFGRVVGGDLHDDPTWLRVG